MALNLLILFLSFSLSKCLQFPHHRPIRDTLKSFSQDFEDKPLLLTPYIESGKIEEARNLSMVPNLVDGVNITSYAGYFTVDKTCGSNMFFWFFPSTPKNYDKMPLGIWLQGGPGASSLYGLFSEIGPIMLTTKNLLKERATAWTKAGSYLFIDNPVGTGFSYIESASKNDCFCRNETKVGSNLLSVVKQFLQLFPELKKSPLFVTGESYAGKYVPALSYAIHTDNQNSTSPINLAGLAIGNGLVDPVNQMQYGDYLYQIGLIDGPTREIFHKEENRCRSLIANAKWAEAFRVFDRLMMGDLVAEPSFFHNVTGYTHYFNYLSPSPPKEGDLTKVLDKPSIRKALHVGQVPFSVSSDVEEMLKEDMMQSVAPWLEVLLDHYRVLIYNGQLDIIVAYPLTESYVKMLQWSGSKDYVTAVRKPWYIGKTVVGYVKTVGNFTEIMVRSAGHMVPLDQPRWSLALIKTFFLNGKFPDVPAKA